MGYIIVDTEGTGLFTHKYPDGTNMPSDAPGQPRMAEFAAVLLDDQFQIESHYQQYIIPVGWTNLDGSPMLEMPQGAYDVNGITFDFLLEHGAPVQMALAVYLQAINDGREVVGWNQQHDGRQVRAELRRSGYDDLFEQTLTTCCMRSCTAAKIKIKKLNGKGGYARLIDAAAHFDIPYAADKRHTALEDAMVTAKIAAILGRNDKLLPGEVHYASNHASRSEGGES
jgi:DNA polymerase III epsilon subunit-like protein